MSGGAQIDVRVSAIETVAQNIKRFRLEPVSGAALPSFSAGSHVVVTMRDGAKTYRNPYSLMGRLSETAGYQISVLKTETSRGGSIFMHEAVKTGSRLTISHPVNLFPVDQRGRKHILLAGGIGITPIIAMAEQLSRQHSSFELHYGVRSAERGAYTGDLKAKYGPRVHIYRDDDGQKVPLVELLDQQPLGTHLYICGPPGMIEFALATAHAAGWPDENVHVERFLPPPAGDPFVVRLAKSQRNITVGEHESILEALEAAGVDAPYLCRGGACGECETAVVSACGELLHNDHYLTPEEHHCGKKIMVCVSRFKGQELVIDL